MGRNIILSFGTIFLLLSCAGTKKEIGKYVIYKKSEINNYFVFHSKSANNQDSLILLSKRTEDCKALTQIFVGESYDFELEKMTYITIEGVNISLLRGQSVNGIKLSGGKKLPYLIIDSCNGLYLK